MKRKDLTKVIFVAAIWGIISIVASGIIFKSPVKNARVPVVEPISTNFPQVSTDSNYKAIFNAKALDPTQLIQIGNSQNDTPFSNSP
jgi:hypothetical protein